MIDVDTDKKGLKTSRIALTILDECEMLHSPSILKLLPRMFLPSWYFIMYFHYHHRHHRGAVFSICFLGTWTGFDLN